MSRVDGVAHIVLAAGLLAHVLLFLRIAVLFAPGLYLGPSGSDRVFYYAYVRSLVLDGDLDFANEMALRPPSSALRFRDSAPLNKYPVGAPLMALPGYAAAHAIMRIWTGPGTVLSGYEKPYVYAYALSNFVVGMLGLGLLYLVVRRYASPLVSAIAVVGASLGTELLRYTTVDLIMSHAVASFALAWCLLAAIRLRESPARLVRWVMVGAASAFVVMVRLQNGIVLLVPGIAAYEALRACRNERAVRRAACIVAAVGGGLLAFTPQLFAWRVMFGAWLANGYSEEMSFTWLAPHFREVGSLLGRWVPLLVVGYAGTAWLALRRRDVLLAALVTCALGTLYVTASWFAFGIVTRTMFDNLAPIALGLAASAEGLRRVCRGAEWAALVLPAMWNVPFMMVYGSSAGIADLITEWRLGVALLLGLAR